MCWNILWRDALVIFRGFNYTSAFFLFFFLQCETNPVDKLHSKDLVVVTLKNRKKRKEKRRRRKNVKNFTPKMVRALRSSLMRFSFYARAWCILPPLLLLPPLLSLQLHFSIAHPPFFSSFPFSLFLFQRNRQLGKGWFNELALFVRAIDRYDG